ncbi:hypothetical protein PRIPAC_78953 [Pristionchus pacificus]|nr:hypothetical protein PRIPAC_78953 [Pristionchus pacificus]
MFSNLTMSSAPSIASSCSTRDKIRQLIDGIATANQLCESSGVTFSRACRGCGSASPADPHASVACGHAVCGECARGATACPECKKRTRFVKRVDSDDRTCCICFASSPRLLDVFNSCGHSICSACSKQMRQSRTLSTVLACPMCRIESAPFSLVESARGVPPGAFPDAERASALFEAVERTAEKTSVLQRLSFASRIEKGSVQAQNAKVSNYLRQRNAQICREQIASTTN